MCHYQIHSSKIITISKSNLNDKYNADGMITQDKDIAIAVLTADCCPIFFFDKNASFISCLHAGWKGCYLNIIGVFCNEITKIQNNYTEINAIIGPCLNRKNFEVEKDFKSKFVEKNIRYDKFFFKSPGKNKYLFDMRGLIKYQIEINGINNIENIDIDTYQNKELFFSHRRSTHMQEQPTGRMINIIGFKD